MGEPLFGCQYQDCATEVSYPANMLAVWEGEPICEECYWEQVDGEKPHWNDLPGFVPEHEKRIKALEADLERERTEKAYAWRRAESAIRTVLAHEINNARLAKENAELRTVFELANELCDAIDRAAEDIGGSRSGDVILRELGPACDVARAILTQQDNAADSERKEG